MLHRINKIINVEPYKIVCEWPNGEIRTVFLEEKIREWAILDASIYKALLDKKIFMNVRIDPISKTRFWQGLLEAESDLDNILDLDPDVLYELSKPETVKA